MVSVHQNVFSNHLTGVLSKILGVDAQLVVAAGATNMKTLIEDPKKSSGRSQGLQQYTNEGLPGNPGWVLKGR